MGLLVKKYALKEANEAREKSSLTAQARIKRTRKCIVEMATEIMPEDEDNVVKVTLSIPSEISLTYCQVDCAITCGRSGQVRHQSR